MNDKVRETIEDDSYVVRFDRNYDDEEDSEVYDYIDELEVSLNYNQTEIFISVYTYYYDSDNSIFALTHLNKEQAEKLVEQLQNLISQMN